MSYVDEPEQRFYRDGAQVPATSAGVPDPTAPAEAWSDEERNALASRKLGPSDWVLLCSFVCTMGAVLGMATATRGPSVSPDVETPLVRQAALDHALQRASPFVRAHGSVFCVALFGQLDPEPALLTPFVQDGAAVWPMSRCLTEPPAHTGRDAYVLSLGKIQWLYGGYAQIIVGDSRRDVYTLKRRDDGWRVIRIEPTWR